MIAGLHPYSSYRDSGVQWLGQIPAHWAIRRLRTVAEMRVSSIDKHSNDGEQQVRLCNYVDVYKNDRITDKISFMKATALPEEVERYRLMLGDVLITKDSETWDDIGVPSLVEYTAPDLVSGYHLALLRTRPDSLLGSFLHRALQARPVTYQFHVSANGVTRYGLPHDAIKSLTLPIPPVEEQQAIGRFIDHTDREIRRFIRLKKKLIVLLKEQKQAVIDDVVTSGLDQTVRLKASGVKWLGDVPEHWVVCRSRRLFSVRTELARPGDVQLSATQAYGVIPQSEFEKRVGRKVVRISMHLDKRRHVEENDFVISMRSFQGGLERAWASGAIRSSYVVLEAAPKVDIGYFAYVFKSRAYIGALQSTADFIRDGQDLTFDNFCSVDLPLIPMDEQQAIARFIAEATTRIDASISKLSREIHLLGELRTRLIADVVTGKLDVRQAASHLPNASTTSQDEEVPAEDSVASESAELDDAEAELTA